MTRLAIVVAVVSVTLMTPHHLTAQRPAGPLVACTSGNYSVSVTPDGTARSWSNWTSHVDTFTVKNTSTDCSDTYALSYTATGTVYGVTLNKTTAFLNPLASTKVVANYSVGDPGTGVLKLKALGTNAGSGVSDTGWFNVTATQPAGSPRVDLTPYNAENQDYSRCAAACFAATYAQRTVPYFSLDAPRGVTLAYNGDRVDPKAFIHVDVYPDPGYGQTPTEYRLEAKVNGTRVGFVNGDTILRFQYPGSSVPVRLGGEFNAASYTTGVYPLDIIVSAYYSPTSIIANTWKRKLIVVNETTSLIGRGWTIAGIQRLYVQSDSSALITSGDGGSAYFAKVGPGFASPVGDFSQLILGTPGGGQGWTRRWPDSTKVVFNTSGRMTEIRDRFNNTTTVIYDVFNHVYQIKDPLNLTTTLTYDAWNFLDYITDPMGRVTQVTVNGGVTWIQDPDLIGTAFGYDASNRLSTITDRRSFTTTLGYDSQSGKLATLTAPAVQVVNANGSDTTASPVTSFEPWQKKGVPYSSTWPNSPLLPPRTDAVYARITDAGGHIDSFTVNRWGMIAVATDALGRTDSTRFDANGLSIRVRSPAGAVDSAVYNASGLPTYVKTSGYPATIIRYVAWGQADSIRTEDGLKGARFFIGANGRVDSVWVAGHTNDSALTKISYDTRGRPTLAIDPLNHQVQSTTYAGTNGNRSQDVLPGARTTTYGYDTYGRRTRVSRAGFAAETTFYSIINRVDSVRDGVNSVATQYGYDSLFRISVTDPKGQIYRFSYNALGWLTQRTDPLNHSEFYKYSRDGELRRWTNRRSQTIEYVYDLLHRRTSKLGTNTATETYAYPSDTVVVATSPVAVDTFLSNRNAQLLRLGTVLDSRYYLRRYTYTAAGALDSVIPSGAGLALHARHYSWDMQLGKLVGISLGSATTSIQHDRDAMLSGITLPGGDAVSRTSNSAHSTADLTTSASYGGTVNRSAGFDAANRIQRQITSSTAGHQLTYDGLGRLTTDSNLVSSGGTPCDPHNPPSDSGDPCTFGPAWLVQGGESFSYDSAGNRRDLGGSYAWGNRIRAFDGCNYDTDSLGDGNVTRRVCGTDTVTFTWTAENRLASLTAAGQTTSFDYNASGQLVKMTKPAHVRHFLWQGDNLLAELDSAGTATIAEYSYYSGLDNPHALLIGNSKYFAHSDIAGNVIALTDSAQTPSVSRWYEYTAWGAFSDGGDIAGLSGKDRARFKGALWFGDALGDLYYMRNRWYEPRTGRFLSEDRAGAGGRSPYTFAANDPVNFRDPTGMVACPQGYELWRLYYDNNHDGRYNDGDTFITYACFKAAGDGGVGSGSAAGASGGASERVDPKACPAPPPAPPIANLNSNIWLTLQVRRDNPLLLPFWFRDQVRNNREHRQDSWDYKQLGRHGQYEAFGNFNYGATGRAAGFSEEFLHQKAGEAQMTNPQNYDPSWGTPKTGWPYGDSPLDAANITAGAQYYDNKCYAAHS